MRDTIDRRMGTEERINCLTLRIYSLAPIRLSRILLPSAIELAIAKTHRPCQQPLASDLSPPMQSVHQSKLALE